MRSKLFMLVAIAAITFFQSCSNSGNEINIGTHISMNTITQDQDGTISLDIHEAASYSDMRDPSGNTAEWDVMVSKTGRYEVWLSSYTKDSTDLRYNNSVKVSVQDNRLEALPEVDRIIQNPSVGIIPYYKADSFMGSMYIQDTGLVNIQVISEKILPDNYQWTTGEDDSKLVSVQLTPEKQIR